MCFLFTMFLSSRGIAVVWRGKWQPTPVFLPGEFQGQRSLAGYSSWGHEESVDTARLQLKQSQANWAVQRSYT